jgi:alkylation response protein AidB-like acyl-CoA dehydrogenase
MATTLVTAVGTDAQSQELLGGMAGGETIATPAVFERPRGWDHTAIDTTATRSGDGWRLDGTKRYVIEGAVADVFLVAARVDDGLGVFVVPAGTDGCTVEGVPSLDATRRLATLHLSGVKLPDDALLGGGPVDGALRRTMLLWTAALACEQVGGARQCLDLSVEYAKSRHQFGRPIGSFQAVKHRCAEMLMKVEHARSVAYHAARSAHDPQEMVIAAPLAGSVASEAYMWAAAETIQIHGGIGFTWEHDAHLYLKRAKTSSLMLGDAHFHRRRLGEALGL